MGENSRRTNPVGNDPAVDEVYVYRAAGPGTPGSTPRLNVITNAMDEIYQAAAAPDALRKNRRGIGTGGMDRRTVGGD